MGAPNVMNPKRGRTVSCHGSGQEVRDGHFRVACSELSTVGATIAPGLWRCMEASAGRSISRLRLQIATSKRRTRGGEREQRNQKHVAAEANQALIYVMLTSVYVPYT